jgi:cytidylate kinase
MNILDDMKIITISREFGSGGRELGKHLADVLGYDYYDKEIIATIASNTGMDENYIERNLEHDRWQNVPLTFHQSVTSLSLDSTHTDLLLERKRVIEEIAKTGKNCIIVGRNADVLLREYRPFNIFVCADLETKCRRCMERSSEDECLNAKELERKIHKIDKRRAQTRALITDSDWGDRSAYHLILNTTDWDLKELALALAEFAKRWFESNNK